MSSLSVVAEKVTLKGTVNRTFLETIFYKNNPSHLDYAEDKAKAGIRLMNADQQGTSR